MAHTDTPWLTNANITFATRHSTGDVRRQLADSKSICSTLACVPPIELGPELLSNPGGPFADTTGWAGNTALLTTVSSKLRVTNDGATGNATAPVETEIGANYQIRAVGAEGAGGGSLRRLRVSNNADGSSPIADSAMFINDNGQVLGGIEFTATATTTYIVLDNVSTGGSARSDWTSVSCRKTNQLIPSLPGVTAVSVRAINASTGQIYYSKNAYGVNAPVSVQKMVLADLFVELFSDDMSVEVTIVADDLTEGGTGAILQTDDVWTREQLLFCTIITSSNNGAKAALRHIGQHLLDLEDNSGGDAIARGFQALNAHAAALGGAETVIASAGGFPILTNYSPVRDIATMLRTAYRNPKLAPFLGTSSEEVTITRGGNPTPLTLSSSVLASVYDIDGVLAGKTGGSPGEALAVRYESPSGGDVIIALQGAASGADRLTDMDAIITRLLQDFPELA